MNNELFKFQAYRFFKIASAFYLGFARESSKYFSSLKMSQQAMQAVPRTGLVGLLYSYAVVYIRPFHWCVVEVVGSRDNVLTLK